MAFSIRKAGPGDLDALVALFEAFAREESGRDTRHVFSDDALLRYRNDLQAWLRSDAQALFVAETGQQVVGYQAASRHFEPPLYRGGVEVYLSEVYVQPEARRQGVATALVMAARAWAEAQGATRLRLTLLDANTESQVLWKKLGATPLARIYTVELAAPLTEAAPAKSPLGFSF